MSIQTELNRISENISNAYAAAQEKGAVLPALQNSDNLEAAIRGIPVRPAVSTPLDPIEVYKSTRPADWLEMPEPQNNEMYLLFHIPHASSSLLAFTVTCTGNYTVALGTVTAGNFVPYETHSIESGAKYEADLSAQDFGNETSSGMVQAMIKISGNDILTWEPSAHSSKSLPANFYNWNIVEISCRLPSGTRITPGSATITKALNKLRYFSWKGTNAASNMQNMFRSCYSLIAVTELDCSNMTDANYMFAYCYSMSALPELDCSNMADASYMFAYCYSLNALPQLDTPNLTNMNNMFRDCVSLTSMPLLDTSKVTTMLNVFNNGHSLTTAQGLDTSNLTRADNLFNYCFSLTKVTFKPTVSGWAGCNISLANCSLDHSAAVELLNSLPTITSSKTLTLTGNPGAALLTSNERAIATNKNWSLTL